MWPRIKHALRWEGFSFLFLSTFAVVLLAMDIFTAAKVFFWLAAVLLGVRIGVEVWDGRQSGYMRTRLLTGVGLLVVVAFQWTMVNWVDNRRAGQIRAVVEITRQHMRFPQPEVGLTPSADVYYTNVSSIQALRVRSGGRFYLRPISLLSETNLYEGLRDEVRRIVGGVMLETGRQGWLTAVGPALSLEDYAKWRAGAQGLYLVVVVVYEDKNGPCETSFCGYIWNQDVQAMRFCYQHNEQKCNQHNHQK